MELSAYATLHVELHQEGRVALLRFEHGKANEMGVAQLRELEQLTADLSAPNGPIALITTSTRRSSKGTPIFVAGANVTERADWSPEEVKAHVRWQRRVLAGLAAVPAFHVAVVDGAALGWGTEYLLTADWRIACDAAIFGLPETSLGILPGAGGTSELWAQIGVAQALRLGMTGERVGADEAHAIGLVQERVASVEAGLARAMALCERVARNSPTAVAAFKRAVLDAVGQPAEWRREREARAYERCVDTGEAAIGRANFDAILAGKAPAWGPRRVELN